MANPAHRRRRGAAPRSQSTDLSVTGAVVVLLVAGSAGGIAYNFLHPRGVFRPAPVAMSSTGPGETAAAKPAAGATASESATPVSSGIPRPAEVQPVSATRAAVSEPREPRIVSAEEARRIHLEGKTLWVDARSAGNYEWAHIPGAINIPASKFEEVYPTVASELPVESTILVYCTGVNCDDATIVLGKMIRAGYDPVRLLYMREGFDVWEMRGFPQVKGPKR